MEKKKEKGILWFIKGIVILILLGVVVYETVMICKDQEEYHISEEEYDEIRETYVKGDASIGLDDEDRETSYPDLQVDFDELLEVNSDFIAWLYFPAVDVSYPVVKEQSIDQYLYLTFEGVHNKAGCIFMDVLSHEDFSGPSDMIFGHNMKNGSMFGSLKAIYKKGGEDLIADNPHIYIYTRDKVIEYNIFAYYTTAADSYSYTEVTSDDEYDDYISYIKRSSMVDIPEGLSFEERPALLTLSTCAGQAGSGRRFVVHTYKNHEWEMKK